MRANTYTVEDFSKYKALIKLRFCNQTGVLRDLSNVGVGGNRHLHFRALTNSTILITLMNSDFRDIFIFACDVSLQLTLC